MTMIQLSLIAIDLIAAAILTFGLYYRRHHRRDLLVAFLGVNVGVLAVTIVRSRSTRTIDSDRTSDAAIRPRRRLA